MGWAMAVTSHCSPMAYLLDLDGTLIDSEPYHKAAEVAAFGRMGLQITSDDLMPCTGLTLGAMLDFVHERFGLKTNVAQFLEVQRPLFTKIIESEVDLFIDAFRFLENCEAPCAIVTSSLPWYVDVVSKKHPILREKTLALVCAADITNGKPHPEPFLTGAARLGVEPSRCWAVEDSVNGACSAKAAGCYVVGMDREGHGRLIEADRVVASFDDL
jgi:HAD superfamily hydrolase (TIGR01509 family)